MSTIYVIVGRSHLPYIESENGYLLNSEDLSYTEIGRTHDFIQEIKPLLTHIPDNTLIFALDNDTDIKTLGQLRKYYETQ